MIDRSIDHPYDRYHNLNLDRNFRSHLGISKESGKISAQPHTTLRIQFLDRKKNDPIEKKNDQNNTLPLGKQFFYNSMGLCGNFTKNRTKLT